MDSTSEGLSALFEDAKSQAEVDDAYKEIYNLCRDQEACMAGSIISATTTDIDIDIDYCRGKQDAYQKIMYKIKEIRNRPIDSYPDNRR